ncbi:MAG: DUF3996 domain-containing protein [Candidatus Krumholzibacteria bacterium]|nr:DUF3996 domain-containing protein [Candidatus Krumholzibacteria bacterium]MCK5619023.1 DUF3996 domain-containing protein [Candidatus Krumholzibacteria bacterium]
MKRSILFVVALALCLAGTAQAKPRGPFGIGIIIGEPTGVDVKVFLNETNAIEGALAWSLSEDNEVHIQAEYLYHFYDWIKVKKGLLPVFFGIGGRIVIRENADDVFGLRIPGGLSYEFAEGLFDVFFEIVPILNLAPDTDFDLEGAIGLRIWF